MSGHTPGPWEIRGGKFVPTQMAVGSKMYVIQTADEHNDNVGFACSWLDDPDTLKEARANANLIAAAPDLLEALIKLLEFWQPSGSPEEHDIQAAGYAAIARAKGEA